MSSSNHNSGMPSDLQRRIDDLEQENRRLRSELAARVQTERAHPWDQGLHKALVANLPNGAVFLVDRDGRFLLADGQAL